MQQIRTELPNCAALYNLAELGTPDLREECAREQAREPGRVPIT